MLGSRENRNSLWKERSPLDGIHRHITKSLPDHTWQCRYQVIAEVGPIDDRPCSRTRDCTRGSGEEPCDVLVHTLHLRTEAGRHAARNASGGNIYPVEVLLQVGGDPDALAEGAAHDATERSGT